MVMIMVMVMVMVRVRPLRVRCPYEEDTADQPQTRRNQVGNVRDPV